MNIIVGVLMLLFIPVSVIFFNGVADAAINYYDSRQKCWLYDLGYRFGKQP